MVTMHMLYMHIYMVINTINNPALANFNIIMHACAHTIWRTAVKSAAVSKATSPNWQIR